MERCHFLQPTYRNFAILRERGSRLLEELGGLSEHSSPAGQHSVEWIGCELVVVLPIARPRYPLNNTDIRQHSGVCGHACAAHLEKVRQFTQTKCSFFDHEESENPSGNSRGVITFTKQAHLLDKASERIRLG